MSTGARNAFVEACGGDPCAGEAERADGFAAIARVLARCREVRLGRRRLAGAAGSCGRHHCLRCRPGAAGRIVRKGRRAVPRALGDAGGRRNRYVRGAPTGQLAVWVVKRQGRAL